MCLLYKISRRNSFVSYKKYLTLVLCVALSSLLVVGCGKKADETALNLPEQESRQLKAADRGIVKSAEAS